MTLVLTAVCPGFVVQVADRLLTTVPEGRPFDPVANKTVVYRAMDGIVTIAYTGTAYIGNIPTDEWIAGVLWGEAISRGPDGRSPAIAIGRRRVNYDVGLACIKLQEALSALQVKAGVSLTISVSGFMQTNERTRPILVEITRYASPADVSIRHLYPREVLPRGRDFIIGRVGVGLDPEQVHRKLAEHRGPGTAIAVENILASVIREKAAVDQTVGSELMSVIIPSRGRDGVVCRFLDTRPHYSASVADGRAEMENVPIGFSPWLVGMNIVYPPSEQTYVNIVDMGQCDCAIIPRDGDKLNGPGVPGLMSPQQRPSVIRTISPPPDPGWQRLNFDTRNVGPREKDAK